MRVGLVGYAQTGKSTLFNALTGLSAQTGIGGRQSKANLGAIKVPDERVDRLSSIYRPRKTTYAEVVFVDVPGPQRKGTGLDSATLQALLQVEALILVLRGFESADGRSADATTELGDFETELVLADLEIAERRLARLRKERGPELEVGALEACVEQLDQGEPLRALSLSEQQWRTLSSYSFLSRRPTVAVLNRPEAEVGQLLPADLAEAAERRGVGVLDVCAALEAEVAALDPSEQEEFLASLGVSEPASARLIRAAYELLEYESFFTVGEDEVRAWTIHRGDPAPRAAGRIHSDLERGFIRVEVMPYAEFIQAGSEAAMKQSGKLRVEGKEYVVRDGDILHVRFNV